MTPRWNKYSERDGATDSDAAAQRGAARLAGFGYLLPLPFVAFANFAVHDRLIVAGDTAATARNILAQEGLFRLSVAADLVYGAGLLALSAGLYVALKPAGRSLAALAALLRFVYALAWVWMTINLLDALRLLRGADYLRAFDADRLQSLARFYLGARFDEYYVGLLFWGLASTLCACLFYKSRYVPKALAAFGVGASLWCAACALAFIAAPGFTKIVNLWWFDSPIAVFEIVTGFWLLLKGARARTAAVI